jgi:hypothetical protein
MTIYTLYKKVDKLSGLHYLGMTTQDAFEYPGSGKDWKDHLENNITDVETTVIFQTTSKKEFSDTGRYYSKLWNIVGAMDDFGNKIWANKIPETGGGPGWGRGDKSNMKNPVTKAKLIASINSPECFEKRSKNNGMKRQEVVDKVMATHSIPENKERFKTIMKEVVNRPDVKAKLKLWDSDYNPMYDPKLKEEWYQKMVSDRVWEKRQENYTPENHGRYDHSTYVFVHISGIIEVCQRYELQIKYSLNQGKLSELVRGKRKIHKGWSVTDKNIAQL